MLANRMQFKVQWYGVFHPNQFGGVRQHSTEDTGVYLTHIVKTSWAKGLKTSMVAFDLTQFFPSLNHTALIAILRLLGFPPEVCNFFQSYLVGHAMSYSWNGEMSDKMPADIGVGQGSAESPILSTLYLVPVMRIFEKCIRAAITTLMSYVNNGSLIVQSRT